MVDLSENDWMSRDVRVIKREVKERLSEELKVGIYIRASTLQQINSEARQRKFALELAAKLGTLIEIFVDLGKTGVTTIGRQGLAEALEYAKSGRINALIVDGISRLGRDTSDTLQLYKQFNYYKCRIFESNLGNSLTWIEVAIKGLVAQVENESRHDTSQKGRRLAVEDGRSPHRPRYGYMLSRTKGIRIKHPERANAVIEIFTEYAKGVSAAEIARSLTGRYATPGDAWRFDCGHDEIEGRSTWTSAMITSIIRCPLYKGKLYDGLTKTIRDIEDYQVKRYEPQEPKDFRKGQIKDPDLIFVTPALWSKANRVLVIRRGTKSAGDCYARHLLTSRVKCASCNEPMTSIQWSGHRGYRCDACRKAGRKPVTIRVAWVERCVLQMLQEQVLQGGYAATLIETVSASRRDRNRGRDASERKLREDIRERLTKINKSFDIHIDAFNETEVEAQRRRRTETRYRNDLESEIEDLEDKLGKLPKRAPDLTWRAQESLEPLKASLALLLTKVPIRPDADQNPDSYPADFRDRRLAEARESNKRTLALIRTIREIVNCVMISPKSNEGLIKVAAYIDLTAEGVVEENDQEALILCEALVEYDAQIAGDKAVSAEKRAAKLSWLANSPQHRIDDDAWQAIAIELKELDEDVERYGWRAKNLVEAYCLRARTKIRVCDLPAAFGPNQTYSHAAKAVATHWGRLRPLLEAHCPNMIKDVFGHLVPKLPIGLPSLQRGISRKKASEDDLASAAKLEKLAETQPDKLRQKLLAVALHLQGVPVAKIAKEHKMSANRTSDLAWKFRRGGVAALGVFVTKEVQPGSAQDVANELRNHAQNTECPDLEIACLALARVSQGVSNRQAQVESGFGVKQFNKWRGILKTGGPNALAASKWPARKNDIVVSARFKAKAAQLRATAVQTLDPDAVKRLLVITMYLEGRANPAIAEAGEFDSHGVRNLVDLYRENGEPGLLDLKSVEIDPEDLRQASELDHTAEQTCDSRYARNLRIVAGCLRREKREALASRLKVTKRLIELTFRSYRCFNREGVEPAPTTGPFTDAQMDKLKAIVARGLNPYNEQEAVTLPSLQQYCFEEFGSLLHHRTIGAALASHEFFMKDVTHRRETRHDRQFREELNGDGAVA